MTDAMTTRAKFRFKVAEFGDGTPWILLENQHGQLAGLESAMFGLDLEPGTTFEQAKEIARYLNAHVAGLSVTRTFDDIKPGKPF